MCVFVVNRLIDDRAWACTNISYTHRLGRVSGVVLSANATQVITKLIKKKKIFNIIVIITAIEPMNRYIVISLLLSGHRKKKNTLKKTLYAHFVYARTFRDLFAHTQRLFTYVSDDSILILAK